MKCPYCLKNNEPFKISYAGSKPWKHLRHYCDKCDCTYDYMAGFLVGLRKGLYVNPEPMRFVYVTGPPGAGKSSFVAELTRNLYPVKRITRIAYRCGNMKYHMVPHIRWQERGKTIVTEIGTRRSKFSGTDALGLHMAPVCAEWIATLPAPILLAEGDRLANETFLDAVIAAGYELDVLYLTAPEDILKERRNQRKHKQNKRWAEYNIAAG